MTGRQYGGSTLRYVIRWHSADPREYENESLKYVYETRVGWYIQHLSGRVARFGEYGRFDSADEALEALIAAYPRYEFEARRLVHDRVREVVR